MYFIIHLNTKDETEYNGVESYVMDKINEGDVSWFPSNKAICLEKEKYLIPEVKAWILTFLSTIIFLRNL